MNLLAFYAYYDPESVASGYLQNDIIGALADCGKVSLHVPVPSRGIDQSVRDKYDKIRHEEQLDGRLVISRYGLMKEGKNPILRAARYFFQNAKQYFIAKNAVDADVMFSGSTPPTQGFFLALAKKRLVKKKGKNVPFIYNLQDIFPDSLAGTGLAKKGGLLWKIGRYVEDTTYKHADKIVVIGESFKQNIMAKGVPKDKIEVVYNWVDENAVVPVAKEDNPLFEEFGISREKFHVVYAGNLGNAQNIDVIVDTAKELSGRKDVEFLIFGTGGLKEQFVEKVKAYGIDNVKFFPLQPMERVSQVYGLGDVCVVSCKPGLGGAAMPSKMLSIMSAGRAVVASFDKGELTYILEQNKCGMYAPAGDVKAFAELIRQMADNREECQKMGENARQLILKKFTKAFGTSEYVRIIKSVCPSAISDSEK